MIFQVLYGRRENHDDVTIMAVAVNAEGGIETNTVSELWSSAYYGHGVGERFYLGGETYMEK